MTRNEIIQFKKVNDETIFRLYKPMLIILLICGYHFDFYTPNIVLTLIAKTYCLILISVVIFATIMCCEVHELNGSLIEYVASVLIILLFKRRTKLFFWRMSDIDGYLRINRRHYTKTMYKLIIFLIIIWCVRILHTYLYCLSYSCYLYIGYYAIKQFSMLALDLNRVWRCILFDGIRHRLKVLRKRLEQTPENDYYLYVRNNKSVKVDKLKFCLFLYRRIADVVDLVSPELHTSLLLSILCSLPKLILNVYHIFAVIEGHEPVETLGFVIMHLLQLSLLLFTPFIAVECYAVEVEKMRSFLMHRLIDHPDSESKDDIEMFLRYTELRPFRYKIWRTIPISAALPLELVNLCISYVIVVINFTHLYD